MNMNDMSDKLPPLVIGKSAKPRCFKNVNSLPVKDLDFFFIIRVKEKLSCAV
jgi:hypothetical protein